MKLVKDQDTSADNDGLDMKSRVPCNSCSDPPESTRGIHDHWKTLLVIKLWCYLFWHPFGCIYLKTGTIVESYIFMLTQEMLNSYYLNELISW